MTRREERDQALQFIFELGFQDVPAEERIENAVLSRDVVVGDYARTLIYGVEANLDELDGFIEENLVRWTKSRISKIAVAILRLSLYELLKGDNVPVRVSINEAVLLAKKYAAKEDAAFVNGVLGSVARKQGLDSKESNS